MGIDAICLQELLLAIGRAESVTINLIGLY